MSENQRLGVAIPLANHESGLRALSLGFKRSICLGPHHFFVNDTNHLVIARRTGKIPNSIVGIFMSRPVVNALHCAVGQVFLMQDVAVFEVAGSQRVDLVVNTVSASS